MLLAMICSVALQGGGGDISKDEASAQQTWYSRTGKHYPSEVSVGGERWNNSKPLPYRFACGAVLNSTEGDMRLDLQNVAVAKDGIHADGDLAIWLRGENYVEGGISANNPTIANYSLLIFGLGSLVVRENSDSAIFGGDVSICAGVALTIYQGSSAAIRVGGNYLGGAGGKLLISMSSVVIHAPDGWGIECSGIASTVNVLGALLMVNAKNRGIDAYQGTVVIDGSIVNILSDSSTAVYGFKTLVCSHSYLSCASSDGHAIYSDQMYFDNSLGKFYSKSWPALVVDDVRFGEGDYHIASGSQKHSAVISDIGGCVMNVAINGGNVQVCAPGEETIGIDAYHLRIEAGRLAVVDRVDVLKFLKYDATVAASFTGVLALAFDELVSAAFGAGATLSAALMANFYSQIIVDAISNAKIGDVKGNAYVGVACNTYTQNHGTVWCDLPTFGVVCDNVPVVNGGSYKGEFFSSDYSYEPGTVHDVVTPIHVSEGGAESSLKCFPYARNGAGKYDKISMNWNGFLPSYYGTGSLYADEYGKLYFWVPQDWNGVGVPTPIYRTISFVANGGSVSESNRRVIDGATIGTLPIPTWTGHDFVGWFTSAGTQIYESTRVTADVTCYAQWTAGECRVTFDANEGSVSPACKILQYGSVYGDLPKPTRSGHDFVGWYTSKTGGTLVTESMVCTGNVTIFARWRLMKYKITLVANGGSVSPSYKMVDYCIAYGELPTPTWSGHTFDGWWTAKIGGSQVTASTKCIGNATIYAHWKMNQYKLTFAANGGTVSPASKMLDYCATCDSFPTPTWGGHTFNGWFTARSGGTKVTAPWKCTGNKTIYAQWTPKQYKVTFNANGGTVTPAYKVVGYCSVYGDLPTPVKSGYTFGGWWTAKVNGTRVTSNTKCAGSATIYAHWEKKQYKLTFDANGGTVSPAYKMVEYCKTCDTFPTPTRGGYTFNGWFTARSGGTKVMAPWKCTGNKTIYAQWTPKQYKLTFDANGGTVSAAYEMVEYCKTCDAFPTPTRGGHTFKGWFTARSGGTKVTAPWKCTGNKTIYAQWTPKQYKVTFNANGGVVSSTYKMVNYCETYGTLPQPTRGGHSFDGWWTKQTGGSLVSSATKCTGNATIYAHWKVKQYKLTFNANGGAVSPTYRMVDYCATYGTLPQPTWGGHTFKGWYTSKTGGTLVSSATKCTGGATIYARWALNQYKLTFNANGGTVSPGYKMVNYCVTYGTLPQPTWSGHTFKGWYTSKAGGSPVSSATKCTGNATIYARWSQNR